jgi:hypothetical protein
MPWSELLTLPPVGEGRVLEASTAFRKSVINHWKSQQERHLSDLVNTKEYYKLELERFSQYLTQLEESFKRDRKQLQRIKDEREVLERQNEAYQRERGMLQRIVQETTASNQKLIEAAKREEKTGIAGMKEEAKRINTAEGELRQQIRVNQQLLGKLDQRNKALYDRDQQVKQLTDSNENMTTLVEELRTEIFVLKHTITSSGLPVLDTEPESPVALDRSPTPMQEGDSPSDIGPPLLEPMEMETSSIKGPLPRLMEVPVRRPHCIPIRKREWSRVPPLPTVVSTPAPTTLIMRRYKVSGANVGSSDPVAEEKTSSTTNKEGREKGRPLTRKDASLVMRSMRSYQKKLRQKEMDRTASTPRAARKLLNEKKEPEQARLSATRQPSFTPLERINESRRETETETKQLALSKVFNRQNTSTRGVMRQQSGKKRQHSEEREEEQRSCLGHQCGPD